MIRTIKKTTGAFGNELEFFITDHYEEEHIIVSDLSCLKERTYCIGSKRELSNYELEPIVITSKQQVIEAWESGEIWF